MSSNMAGGMPVFRCAGRHRPAACPAERLSEGLFVRDRNGPRVMATGIRRSTSICTTSANGLTPELREVVLTVTVAAKPE